MKVNREIIKKIVKKLPPASAKYAVRDISFLSCTIFTETHLSSFKKFFNFDGFSIVFWYRRPDKNVVFYRSSEEYENFSIKVVRRYLRNFTFAQKTAATLISMSDEINKFIRKNKSKKELLKNFDYFFKLYRDFFTFHQAAFWPTEYLLTKKNTKNSRQIKKIVKIMDKAYKYNETVVPNVEAYLAKLGVSDFSYREIKKTKKPGRRSVLLLDKKIYIISASQAGKINQAIEGDYQKYLSSLKNISGLAVSPGKATGKVRLVKNLKDLQYCQSGDVLVVTQTRPQYNTFIRKVKAIVTDEGGLLCHASMLAREFKMPCVVGTKNATKVLKDGMIIEVDAYKGVIKILK